LSSMTSPLICVRSLCGCVEFRRQLEVNVTGQLAVTQALLPLLRRARGRIVLIGSIGTRFTPPFTGPVSASKSTIATMAEALRQKLAPWDIHVVLIEPASVHTEAVDKLDRDAERLLRESNPYARALYEDAFRRFVRIGLARERNGSPPQVVAQAVGRALTSRRPHSHYLVGKDSLRMAVVAAALPTPSSTPCATGSAAHQHQAHGPRPQQPVRLMSVFEPAVKVAASGLAMAVVEAV
jgi:NAD(P)-dependent dehydrogenase (short-subunit alcohol dehydrogenase family)